MSTMSKKFRLALESLSDADWFVLCDALWIARKHAIDCAEQVEFLEPRANYAEHLRKKAERFEDIRESIGAALNLI